MNGIGSDSDPSPPVAQYPILVQMGLAPLPGVDVVYKNLPTEALTDGTAESDYIDTGTRLLSARQLRYDLRRDSPRITTKFMTTEAVKGELLWSLRGGTNVH